MIDCLCCIEPHLFAITNSYCGSMAKVIMNSESKYHKIDLVMLFLLLTTSFA